MLKNDWKTYLENNTQSLAPEGFIDPTKHSKLKIQLMLEILEGCAYNCSGCFVKRRKNFGTGLGLDLAAQLVDELTEEYALDDIILGPTDFFSSGNIIDVLDDSRFQKVVSALPDDSGIQHNCSIDFFIQDERVQEVITHIENSYLLDRPFDVQIAVDLHMLDNPLVHDLIDKRLETMQKSKLEYEVSLVCNITQQINDNVLDTIEMVNSKWDTIIEWAPSVVRALANKPEKMLKHITGWNHDIGKIALLDEQRFRKLFTWLQSDNSHKSFNEVVVSISNDELYIVPFLYENSPIYHSSLKVDVKDNVLNSIVETKHNIEMLQYKNMPNLVCNGCKYVQNCSSRLIPTLITDVIGRNECLINKQVMALYDNIGYNS